MNLEAIDLGSGAFLLLPPLLILVALLLLIFEVWMFIDAFQNPRLNQTERLLWCLAILLIHPFAAIVYYFLGFSRRK